MPAFESARIDIAAIADKLPPFPVVVSQLLAELRNDTLSMESLVRITRNDPVISANILSAANRIRRMHALNDVSDTYVAAQLIGVNRIQRIIVTLGMNRFLAHDTGSDFLFWHSRAVAIIAQELAMLTRVSPEKAYVAAILHDIGQLCFHILDPLAFQEAYNLSGCDGLLLQRETALFGVDHSLIGAALATHWQLPQEFALTILDHHKDNVVSGKLPAVINLAESLSRALDIPPSPKNRVAGINRSAMDLLGIEWDTPAMRDCYSRCRARYRHAVS
jgi:putative nucleotidyltransferase with HDIG domain